MKRLDTNTETSVIKKYENGESMKKISDELKIGIVSVKNILERFGIPILQKKILKKLENIFIKISKTVF